MTRLNTVNTVLGVFFIVLAFSGLYATYGLQNQFGLVYEQVTIVEDVSVTETINLVGNYIGSGVILFTGLLLLANKLLLDPPDFVVDEYETNDITFPDGEPSVWNIERDMSGYVHVTLGSHSIGFPMDLLAIKESS